MNQKILSELISIQKMLAVNKSLNKKRKKKVDKRLNYYYCPRNTDNRANQEAHCGDSIVLIF
jgi:hypothetical protein